MGHAAEIQAPKGLSATRYVGAHMSSFIANYKVGKKESFMYGGENKNKQKLWFDYDLTAVYTTRKADLTLPYFFYASLININELDN